MLQSSPTAIEIALNERHSVRAYQTTPVSKVLLEQVLLAARRAPSGANLQPGFFHVLTGSALAEFSSSLCDVARDGRKSVAEYSYFPKRLSPELKAKQRAAGFALYDALGLAKRDIAARKSQFLENYRFFNAPVGVVVSIQRDMGKGCYMDLGMTIMALLMAAHAEGLGSTGIGALANYADVAHTALGMPESHLVVCGIALGYADTQAAVNQFRTKRDELSQYAEFRGFDPIESV